MRYIYSQQWVLEGWGISFNLSNSNSHFHSYSIVCSKTHSNMFIRKLNRHFTKYVPTCVDIWSPVLFSMRKATFFCHQVDQKQCLMLRRDQKLFCDCCILLTKVILHTTTSVQFSSFQSLTPNSPQTVLSNNSDVEMWVYSNKNIIELRKFDAFSVVVPIRLAKINY